jgi:hypothetical protein
MVAYPKIRVSAAVARHLSAVAVALSLVGGISISGCQQRVDSSEYGQVEADPPKLNAKGRKYPLPQLSEDEDSDSKSNGK